MATADRLRPLLLTPEAAAGMDAHGTTDAAVLIPLFVREAELVAVLTERRGDMRRHAGEISFPGGRQDEPDEDLRTTALREAEEEIGLPGARSSSSVRCPPPAPSSRATGSTPSWE